MRRPLLLDNRDFTLLWGGETLSEVGSQVSTVAYPLLVLALTGSPAKAGVVGLARWLPLAVFALPAGALAAGYLFQHSGSSLTLLVAAGWIFALAVATCSSPAIRRHRGA